MMAETFLAMNPHQIDFGVQAHTPKALSFGFGFGFNSAHSHNNTLSSAYPPVASTSVPRSAKRRIEDDSGDERMDARSPTPEARRRLPTKRLRAVASTTVVAQAAGTFGRPRSELNNKHSEGETYGDEEPDIGVILAMLPSNALLPLLVSLVKAKPDVKQTLHSLMPKPTLESAIEHLTNASNRLRQFYPYVAANSIGKASDASPDSSILTTRPLLHGSMMASTVNTGASDQIFKYSYMQSRIGPHLSEFVSTVMASLPFFSCGPSNLSTSQHMSTRVKTTPTETFTYLSAITNVFLSLPPPVQVMAQPLLAPRILQEWFTWLERVDEIVNRERGMFGQETLKVWHTQLNEFAARGAECLTGLERLRDLYILWVNKVGWLLGRSPLMHMMDDDEE